MNSLSTYAAGVSIVQYGKCPNASVNREAARVSVQYSYPPAYLESHYKLAFRDAGPIFARCQKCGPNSVFGATVNINIKDNSN